MSAHRDASIDQHDLQKFASRSSEWWSQMVPLHRMNELRIPFIQQGLVRAGQVTAGKNVSDIKVLEVGCGGGILSEAMSRVGYSVTAIDPCAESIQIATAHAEKDPALKINYVETSIREHSDAFPSTYDAVVASEVVEHVKKPDLFLKECVKSLKPGGSVIITTINRTILSWFVFILLFEYILRIIPLWTHSWSNFRTASEIKAWLKQENCKVMDIKGMWYLPIKTKWYWNRSLCLGYALHAVKQQSS